MCSHYEAPETERLIAGYGVAPEGNSRSISGPATKAHLFACVTMNLLKRKCLNWRR